MAEVIWAEPALNDLDAIADYIALDNPEAARRLMQKIFEHVDHLESHPRLGSKPEELKGWRYRSSSRRVVSSTEKIPDEC
jgi:toxin ParE1/3/4